MLAVARASRVGGAPGRRRAVRDHAVRHRGDARPARREGLRDRRPGHRRHRDARRPRDGLDREPVEGRLRRATLARARDTVRPDRKQLVGLLPTILRCSSPRERSSSRLRDPAAPGAHARPRHVVVPERRARADARARDWSRAAARARRDDPRGRWAIARRPCTVTDPVFYDPEGATARWLRLARRSRTRPRTSPRSTLSRSVPCADRRAVRPGGRRAAGLPARAEHGRGRHETRCAVARPRRVARRRPAGDRPRRPSRSWRPRSPAHHAVVDVSDEPRGDRAPRGAAGSDLLATGCSLDLDPRGGWVPGSCAQTLFARRRCSCRSSRDATRVFVRPSFAELRRGSPVRGPLTPARPYGGNARRTRRMIFESRLRIEVASRRSSTSISRMRRST